NDAACIQRTAPGYPILPPASFETLIRAERLEPEERSRWLSAVAREVAAEGASESLLVMANGNAYEITFAAGLRARARIVYFDRFLRSGEYNAERYRTVGRAAGLKALGVTRSVGASGVPQMSRSPLRQPAAPRREST